MAKSESQGPGVLGGHIFSDMMVLRDSRSARVSSWDRSGANKDFRGVCRGETLELAHIPNAGCIRHIYFTLTISESAFGDPRYLRDMVFRAFWDGEETPSIEVPFGDFFGQGHGCIRFFRSLTIAVNEGAELVGGNASTVTVGFNSYFPMPFANGARLTLTNEGDYDVAAVWYHIDYERLPRLEADIGRFHAQWRRENPTVAFGAAVNVPHNDLCNLDGRENYVILEASGHGNFAGYFLNVHNFFDAWYGEGDDMIFIDGEQWPPSLHGTGTEECFGGGACPNSEYAGLYTGFHLVGNKNFQGKTSMYRFHVADPVRFTKSIRVTIEHGHANNFANDYSSTAFWYQSEPHGVFPALLPRLERRPVQGDDPHDRAYAEFHRLQANVGRCRVLLSKDSIALPESVRKAVHEDLAAEIRKAFDAKDYSEAARKAAEASKQLCEFLDGHEARSGA